MKRHDRTFSRGMETTVLHATTQGFGVPPLTELEREDRGSEASGAQMAVLCSKMEYAVQGLTLPVP